MNSDSLGPTLRRLLAVAATLGVAGCFSLGRTEPLTRHYLLGATVPEAVSASPPPSEGAAVGIRRLQIPAYLEPPLIAVRWRPGEVGFSEYHRWAEPLGDGINRAVAGHLQARNTFRVVDVAPWEPRTDYDYAIQLQVEHFEGVATAGGAGSAGDVHMRIGWEIVRQSDRVVLARGTTEHHEAGWQMDDYSALVQSLDVGVGTLANELAAALEGLATRTTSLPPAATVPSVGSQ